VIRSRILAPLLVPLLAASLAAAPARATSLDEALATADRLTAVVTAELELSDAQRELARTEADPAALRLERLQARQAVALARAELRSARFGAYLDIASAYTQVLQAEAQRGLAEDGLALAERGLEIARIRLERGAGTQLDVRDAETDLAGARSDLAAARQGEALARRSFASLTDLPAEELEPVPDALLAIELPEAEVLEARLDEAPPLLQAAQGQEVATVARRLLDPAYAPARDIDAAELRVAQAEEALREARRGLELQLQSLIDQVAAARDRLEVAREALADARERDDVERSRLEAGLIADIAYQRTRLSTRQAELSALQAEHDLLLALLRLQADAGVPLEGLDGF
jgi:outer membrane protein TolC